MGTLHVNGAFVKTTVLTVIVVALQLALFSTARIGNVVVMIVWMWPVALGLAGSTSLALWGGLAGGVLFDTHCLTPFGLTALVGAALGYGAAMLGKEGVGDLVASAWWMTPGIGALAGFVAPLLYVVGGIFYLNVTLFHGSVGEMMGVNFVAFFLLMRPLTRVAQWSVKVGRRR